MNKTAPIKVRQNAKKFGLTLAALILAVLLVGMAAVVPGPVSAQDDGDVRLIQDPSSIRVEGPGGGEPVTPPFGAPAESEIIFQQPPYDPWVTAWASDKNMIPGGYLCMEDFWGLTGDIVDIHWWGLSVISTLDCDPTGMEFEIIFYQDAGGFPGAPVATFSNISPTVTYLYTYAYSVYRFDVADLGTRVSLTNGWVSIQSTYSPNGCSFWWLNSPVGNINAIQQGGKGNLTDNLAFALTKSIPPPNVKYLHSTDGLFNLTKPIGTQWHELYPLFCREYHLSSWEDNGDGGLSPSDQIDMYEKPDGEVRWYHVDEVTITLFVTPVDMIDDFVDNGFGRLPLGQPMYIELEGGYNASALTAPNSTQWHEIYPNFCREYELTSWEDNKSGKLDLCDYIWLQNKRTGEETYWHVEEVAVDITVTIKPPPVGGEAYPVNKASLLAPWIVVAVFLAGGAGWYVLRRRRAQS